MPAHAMAIADQAVSTPWVAVIAVIGIPIESETIPSANCFPPPDRSLSPAVARLGLLGVAAQLRGPHGGQLLHPLGQAGGDVVLEVRPSSSRAAPGRGDVLASLRDWERVCAGAVRGIRCCGGYG